MNSFAEFSCKNTNILKTDKEKKQKKHKAFLKENYIRKIMSDIFLIFCRTYSKIVIYENRKRFFLRKLASKKTQNQTLEKLQ